MQWSDDTTFPIAQSVTEADGVRQPDQHGRNIYLWGANTRRMVATRLSNSIGLASNSSHPVAMAFSRSPSSACADMPMIGMSWVCGSFLRRRTASQRSSSGISRSIRITSGCSLAAKLQPFSLSSAAITSKPPRSSRRVARAGEQAIGHGEAQRFRGLEVARWMVRSGLALSFKRYSHEYDAEETAAIEARAGQHSLPSGRYSLLGPDFHRLDRASFAWRTHSITSSAVASSVGGISRPSVFAIVRFMMRSNLVGNSTGRSPGFAPCRILST